MNHGFSQNVNIENTVGFYKDIYGSIIKVILKNNSWIIFSTLGSGDEIIVNNKQIYDTEYEASSGRKNTTRKFSKKKYNGKTFIEKSFKDD